MLSDRRTRGNKSHAYYIPGCTSEDISLPVPLSRTCGRLRTIALSRPSWWTYLSSQGETCVHLILILHKGLRAIANILPRTIVKGSGAPGQGHLTRLLKNAVAPRLRELHVLYIDYRYVEPLFSSLRKCQHPDWRLSTPCATSQRWPDRGDELHRDSITSYLPYAAHYLISYMASGMHSETVHILDGGSRNISRPGPLHITARAWFHRESIWYNTVQHVRQLTGTMLQLRHRPDRP